MNNLISEHIDFHSHILPQLDDGSKDLQMSVSLLESAKKTESAKLLRPLIFIRIVIMRSSFLPCVMILLTD